jgi:hypothetical protein
MNTKPISKTNPNAKIISCILALILAGCSLSPAENTATTETQPSLVPNTPTYTATASQTPTADPTATIEPSPTLVPTKSPEQVLAEFKESAEYKQGLQDYLDAMGLEEEQVVVTLETKTINEVEYQFVVVSPDFSKLNDDQKNNGLRYESCPLFILDEMRAREVMIRDLAGGFVGTTASYGDKDSGTLAYQNRLYEFGLVSLSSAFSNRYWINNNNPDHWTYIVSNNKQDLKIKEMYYPVDVRSAFKGFNGSQEELIEEADKHIKQRSRDILNYIVKYNMQGKTTIELANEVFHYNTYVGAGKMPLLW